MLPIAGRGADPAERPALALPINRREMERRPSLELPIAGRSVISPAGGLPIAARERNSCALPIAARDHSGSTASLPLGRQSTPEPASATSAASASAACGALSEEWESSSEGTPRKRLMTKAKSNPQVPGAGDETPISTSHRRMSSAVHYKGFISQHSSDISVYDRYDFGNLLGEGAAGSTWEAFPKVREGARPRSLSGQDAARAIKKVLKRRVYNSTESFLAEVEVLKQLDHPNICKLYEVFEDADNIYLVMDLCRGGELFDRITEGALGEAEVSKLIRQLAHALRYCHDRGIIHRDIKPENILFVSSDAEAPAKLIDFGIACHFKQTEHRKGEKGTEAYEAPEVKNDESSYSEKCDLWSLGVLLYAMLSSSLPFSSAEAARKGIFSTEGSRWRDISPEAKDLIRQLLVVDPSLRLSAAQVLEHPWVSTTTVEDEEAIPAQVAVRLRRYQSTSYFRRILLMVVARHLGANDLPEIYNAFKAMDTNGDGSLSLEEFRRSLHKGEGSPHPDAPLPKEAAEYLELFEALDADGSGAIDYSEFMAAAIDRKIFFREDLCLQVFRALDRDSSGTISIQELFQLLKDADPEDLLGNDLRDEVMELLDRYDTDGDGELNFREFMALLTQNREASPPKRLQKRGSQTTDSVKFPF